MKNSIQIIFLFLSISMYSQGPWTKEKGKFYTQLSFTTIPSYNEFFGNPDYEIQGNITDNTMQIYGEYGLTNTTTLLVNIPLKLISIDNLKYIDPTIDCVGDCSETINKNRNSLGNIEIGVKHNFYKKDWLLSGQFSVEGNTGSFDENQELEQVMMLLPLLLYS
ncbi:hypothetical protein SHK09_01850 [Polaribacter sp. PL03]|uniref:hypothetical protein n=1 Tax=Polaribacter sp. PL03 TaxID=3088353 RepID=UPI0029CFC42A|nr:hypothetical protein [Polaribacter sp. PL03]MDX6745520.1 hypothetical protein [Polaribacter sp. PL03]